VISLSDATKAASGRAQLRLGAGRHDQVKAGDADQHAGHRLPEDGGKLQSHHQLGDRPGGDEDHHEAANLQQRCGGFELMGTELQQLRGEGASGAIKCAGVLGMKQPSGGIQSRWP